MEWISRFPGVGWIRLGSSKGSDHCSEERHRGRLQRRGRIPIPRRQSRGPGSCSRLMSPQCGHTHSAHPHRGGSPPRPDCGRGLGLSALLFLVGHQPQIPFCPELPRATLPRGNMEPAGPRKPPASLSFRPPGRLSGQRGRWQRIEREGEDGAYRAGDAEPRWRQKEKERERDPRLGQRSLAAGAGLGFASGSGATVNHFPYPMTRPAVVPAGWCF